MPGVWSIVVATADGAEAELINLASMSCEVSEEQGTGAPELQIVAPADLFQRQRKRPRQIVLTISSAKRQAALPALRATLSKYLTPDIVGDDAPLKLRYTLASVVYELPAYFAPSPDDLNRNDGALLLRFVSYDAAWKSTTAVSQQIYWLSILSNVGYVLLRSAAGVWSAPSGGPAEDVLSLFYASATALYAGTTSGNVWKWDGSAWSQLGSSLGGAVRGLLVSPDGTLYAAGSFVTRVALWSGSAWVGVGVLGGTAYDPVIFRDGTLYVGTTVAGYVQNWNGASWGTPGTGLSAAALALELGPDGLMYAGGPWGVARLVSGVWTILTAAYTVEALSFQPDGRLVVAHTTGAAIWNGVSWTDLVFDSEAFTVLSTPRGVQLVGQFTTAGGVELWSSWAIRRGGTFFSGEVDVVGTYREVLVLAGLVDGQMAVGMVQVSPGAATVYSMRQHAITVTGTAAAYPSISVTYPSAWLTGQLWSVVNLTTGEELHFENLKISKGETVTIDCETATVSSSYRGDLSSTVRSGSTALRLLPYVVNNLLFNGDNAFVSILSYDPRYVTLDSLE